MALKLITAPATEPVTLAEAKSHLRVDITEDDTYIGTLITAARNIAETWTARALVTQTWELYMDAFPANGFTLPRPPLQSITSIKYTPLGGAETTVSSSLYKVDAVTEPGCVVLASDATWPSTTLVELNGVVVRFAAGYGAAAAVPQAIKQAILMLVGTMYESREDVLVGQGATANELPLAAKRLLLPYRMWRAW